MAWGSEAGEQGSVSESGLVGGGRWAFPSLQGRAWAVLSQSSRGEQGPFCCASQELERVGRVLTQPSRFQGMDQVTFKFVLENQLFIEWECILQDREIQV